MSKSNSAPFVCDNCGTTKTGEADARWRIVVRTSLMGVEGVSIYEWDDTLAALQQADHSCGDHCALVLLERFLHFVGLDAEDLERAKKGATA